MPQSTAALRQRAETLRLLRNPSATPSRQPVGQGTPNRPVWARTPWVCPHGTCLALEVREGALWVKVRDTSDNEAWAPIARILSPEQRREWARRGFG